MTGVAVKGKDRAGGKQDKQASDVHPEGTG